MATNESALLSIYARFLVDHETPFAVASTASHAICLDSGQSDAWAALGATQLRTGRAADAVESCRQAFELDPGNVQAK